MKRLLPTLLAVIFVLCLTGIVLNRFVRSSESANKARTFTDYWNQNGQELKPEPVSLEAGKETVRCVVVGFTGICPNPKGANIDLKCLYYSGSPSKRMFFDLSADVDNNLAQNPPSFTSGAYLEVKGRDISAFHKCCKKAAQFEKQHLAERRFAPIRLSWRAMISETEMERMEIDFPKCKLWGCRRGGYDETPKTIIGERVPMALISKYHIPTTGTDAFYGMLATGTPRDNHAIPPEWWRHWRAGDRNARLDIFDFSSYCGDSFAKLAEMTDPAYLDYVWRLAQEK